MKIQFIIFIFSLFSIATVASSQILDRLNFFPASKYIHDKSANQTRIKWKLKIYWSIRDIVASMGGVFPVVNIDLPGTTLQASLLYIGSFRSLGRRDRHMWSQPIFTSIIWSSMFRWKSTSIINSHGYTSHHLSDNWYEKLHNWLTQFTIQETTSSCLKYQNNLKSGVCAAELERITDTSFDLQGEGTNGGKFTAVFSGHGFISPKPCRIICRSTSSCIRKQDGHHQMHINSASKCRCRPDGDFASHTRSATAWMNAASFSLSIYFVKRSGCI